MAKTAQTRPNKRAPVQPLPDVVANGLDALFVGINPSLYSARVGHHFARPGNRFWPALHGAGFTARQLHPSEDRTLLASGIGLTNLCDRPTARADELDPDELRRGAARLMKKVDRIGPEFVAFVGIGAYRTGLGEPGAHVGLQAREIVGARVWVLPNPSGLNAHYQLPELVRAFAELREFVAAARCGRP
jgi:TDG/mug DNA glycosylase family protein